MARPTDLAVVGGGPAGLAVAIEARARGLEVDVFDRAHPPIDKACGEGLMPGGLACLDALGVRVDPEGCAPFDGIRYIDCDSGGEPVVAEGSFPGGSGLGVRRTHLHGAMVERARATGVRLHWGHAITGLHDDGVLCEGEPVAARWVVAADGLHSRVRQQAGLQGRAARSTRFGVRRHYRLRPWSRFVEVYWTAGHEAYVTPAGPDRVGVAMLWSAGKARFDGLLAQTPGLAAKLEGAEVTSQDRGAGPLMQQVRGVRAGRVLLVGDASGYIDALTGEGLALAFRQARELVAAVARDRPQDYPAAHARVSRAYVRFTRLMLMVSRRPWLRRRVVRALAAEPALFSGFLGLVEGHGTLRTVGVGGAARLGRRLLTG